MERFVLQQLIGFVSQLIEKIKDDFVYIHNQVNYIYIKKEGVS